MQRIFTNIGKWLPIPLLLLASSFSALAGRYQSLFDVLVCMGAVILVQRTVLTKQYVSGAGLVAIVLVFSPLFLAIKIVLLLVLACVVALVALLAAYRVRPVPVI